MRRWSLRLAPVIGIAVFLLAWELFVRVADVRAFILRSPSDIISYLRRAPDDFLRASAITAWHASAGLVLALLISLVVGAAMAASPFIERATGPVLVLLQVTPFVAYISSVVVWLGAGNPPVLFITALVCMPPFTFAVVAGMRGADPATREILASVNASRWAVLWRLRLPSAMPSVLTTARYNVGLASIAAYLVEGSNFANEGLGSIGRAAAAFNQGDPLWATIFCMALLGSVGLLVVAAIERWVLHWHASQRSVRRARAPPERLEQPPVGERGRVVTVTPMSSTPATEPPPDGLGTLRERIDHLDRELVRIVAERLALCEEVAAVKEESGTAVIQPGRVRDVVTTRRQFAIDAGVDPDFGEQLFRVLLAETHRIEVAGQRPDAAPDKTAAPDGIRSGLDTVATRIDHVVVAVTDLDGAVRSFTDRFGFHRVPLTGGDVPGIVALAAGGVTVILVGAMASPAVDRYLAAHGGGVQHIAVEVLNAGYARACLDDAAAPLLTDVVIDADGHEQFFAARDPASGVQLSFISRTGHRVGVGATNVLALFGTLTDG